MDRLGRLHDFPTEVAEVSDSPSEGAPGAHDADDVARVPPSEAWERLRAEPGALLVDVRSDMEFLMIGHPRGAVNVPWIDAPDWTVNPRFVAEVRKLLLGRPKRAAPGRDGRVVGRGSGARAPLFLICRSGNRSVDAARALAADGVDDAIVVAGGFEGPLDEEHHRGTIAGWRHAGLPWEQC